MYQPDDIVRSIRRYVLLTLDAPPWRVRTERREIADDERPVAVIQLGDLVTTFGGSAGLDQGNIEELVPVTIYAYQAFMDGTDFINERVGRANADELRVRLHRLIDIGIPVTNSVTGRPAAGPFVLPLHDYAGVPREGDREEPEDPVDILRVEVSSLTSRIIQDLEDPRRFGVVCEFSAKMELPGRVKEPDAPVLTRIGPGTAEPS